MNGTAGSCRPWIRKSGARRLPILGPGESASSRSRVPRGRARIRSSTEAGSRLSTRRRPASSSSSGLARANWAMAGSSTPVVAARHLAERVGAGQRVAQQLHRGGIPAQREDGGELGGQRRVRRGEKRRPRAQADAEQGHAACIRPHPAPPRSRVTAAASSGRSRSAVRPSTVGTATAQPAAREQPGRVAQAQVVLPVGREAVHEDEAGRTPQRGAHVEIDRHRARASRGGEGARDGLGGESSRVVATVPGPETRRGTPWSTPASTRSRTRGAQGDRRGRVARSCSTTRCRAGECSSPAHDRKATDRAQARVRAFLRRRFRQLAHSDRDRRSDEQ